MNRRVTRRTALAAPFAVSVAAARQPDPPRVEAYTDQLSYAPGDVVRLHVSSDAPALTLTLMRLGPKTEVIWENIAVRAAAHPAPADASSHGCRWPMAGLFKVPSGSRSGYYVARFDAGGRPAGKAFFVVRAEEPGRDAKILIQLSTNTYNAYTNFGGYSLYAYNGRHKVQGRRVSFDRPQTSQFPQWEEPFIRWAESNGYKLDYAVNSDLEFRPDILKKYKLILSVGHDEYWSAPMRDNMEKYIEGGGNVAFFSGNTCCWQVRSEDHGRALACWKQSFGDDPAYKSADHKLLSTAWSHHFVKRPENALTGVGFLWGGYHRSHGQFMDGPGTFTAHRPDHWLFQGTGVKRGDAFGAKLPAYKVVGYECDGCELAWKDGLPHPTHRDGTPANFEVLATCPARWHPDDCEWYEKWEKGRTGNAVLGCYTRGGTVVTVGTTDWSHGLRGNDAVVVRMTKNVLDKLGA